MDKHSQQELTTDNHDKPLFNNKSMKPVRDETKRVAKREDTQFKIEWRELTYYQKPSRFFLFGGSGKQSKSGLAPTGNQPKRILDSLDGCFRSGQLSAILGPSGAGKSTFLSALFGPKQENALGQTRVTWYSGSGKESQLKLDRPLRIASLPQHDHLLNHLTVYETLMFASRIKNASTKLPENPSKNFHRHNVRRVSKMLKLTECLDTRCGKLSGGQHKRVSIAQELLSEPDVIILDEPTSGLDAMTCLTTVQTLKSIVIKHPICIILTIHQPDVDVFGLFDHVYVIAQGGLAIYEGPPDGIEAHLDSVGLKMPGKSYNPARFIVENAFVAELFCGSAADESMGSPGIQDRYPRSKQLATICELPQGEQPESSEEDEYVEELDKGKNYLQRSLLSLTDAISGKELSSGVVNKRDKKPLLSIGIQTLEGKLITSHQLKVSNRMDESLKEQAMRMNLLRQMNAKQKSCYKNGRNLWPDNDTEVTTSSSAVHETTSAGCSLGKRSGYSSGKLSAEHHSETDITVRMSDSCNRISRAQSMSEGLGKFEAFSTAAAQSLHSLGPQATSGDLADEFLSSTESSYGSTHDEREMVGENEDNRKQQVTASAANKRRFDKRLSAKHSCSQRKDNPVWRHTLYLAHRTWLSIVRDPIFFGIQACMHTVIPILLATIFGSVHEEGCPRIGSFDLVSFAYSDSDDMIQSTVSSIRESIGNIGILFFQMFVLSFSINCITALVFPLDMHVLLKEYRNGWYSMRAYFFGRTIADLPVPVVLHTMAMAILYFMTGQPLSWWRFWCIVLLVILASLVSQSVGLTIGALLMKSSQSAVLAAAAIVAPFFALSGFIVRIHTLPWLAQAFAKTSYLYHLLNGFIIMRYGFGRCQCNVEDFEQNESHQIPSNLHTLASMWIGTYSNEYPNSTAALASAGSGNRTNVDPNIDVVDKMMNAFKMANSYGHQISTCEDVLPYAMLDFNLRDQDIYLCFIVMVSMLLVSRCLTFASIYYKVRSFA